MVYRKDRMILSVDFGSSMTKVIGSNQNKGTRAVVGMEPEVIELPREFLDVGTETEPENRAWVGLGDKTIAVGFLAKYKTTANPMLRQPKVNTAAVKVLAAIWVVKEELKLNNILKIDLCCLLPPGEYQDREKLEKELRQIEEFDTPSGKMKIAFSLLLCKVEGEGILMRHNALRQNKGSGEIALVMMGFRNTSAIVVARNQVIAKASSDLGFAKLAKLVIEETSALSWENLTPALASYLETGEENQLYTLFWSSNSSEIENLKKTIELAKIRYLADLENWFKEVLPLKVREIVLGGGTVDTLKLDIFEILKGRHLYLHANVDFPKDIAALNYGNRFADLWCIWDYFGQKLRQNLPQKEKVIQ